MRIFLYRLYSASRRCSRRRAPSRRAALERGTAITDPATLRELDGGRFRLDRMLLPERSADIPLTNSELFALPSMTPVRQAIDGEFDRYVARHKASLPKETIGVGEGFDFQLFDRALLYSRRHAVRAGRHRQPHGPHLRRGSQLRRDPPDLPPDADATRRPAITLRRRGCR